MLVVTRFRVPPAQATPFRQKAREALGVLAGRPGFVRGNIGRSVDEPTLWIMTTEWKNVGAYRRALSSYEVKLGAVELLSSAIDEPSAFELLTDDEPSALAADADTVRLGRAAAPNVPTDLD